MRLALAAGLAFSAALWGFHPAAGRDDANATVRREILQAQQSVEAGDPVAAERHYLDALGALELLSTYTRRDRGFLLRQVANLRLRLGRLREARAAAVAALLDAEAAKDDELAGWVMYDLAGIDLAEGAYDAAAMLAERASDLAEADACLHIQRRQLLAKIRILAREIASASQVLNGTAAALDRTDCGLPIRIEQGILKARAAIWPGDFEKAAEILGGLQRAPEVRSNSEAMAQITYNLTEVELLRGRYAEANVLNEEAANRYRKVVPADHDVLAQIDHRAAVIRQEIGDLPASDHLYLSAELRLAASLGPSHPFAVATRRERSQLLSRMGDHAGAVLEARKVLSLTLELEGTPHAVALANAALGLALHAVGEDPHLAEHHLMAAQEGFVKVGGSEADRTPSLLALSEIALARGDADRAERYAEEANRDPRRERQRELGANWRGSQGSRGSQARAGEGRGGPGARGREPPPRRRARATAVAYPVLRLGIPT